MIWCVCKYFASEVLNSLVQKVQDIEISRVDSDWKYKFKWQS